MIKLSVTNEKNLELYELEKVHVGENKFGFYLIFLPEILNGYNLSDCEVKLIQIFEDGTSVAIDIDTTQETRPIKEFITLDATAQAQMVTLSVLITHNGNVIGKTNQKTYQVYPTKNATPIDPREELDEIIADLRADKAQLETTVSDQAAEITEKTAQITELSGEVANLNTEVTELTSDNTRLENLTDTQRETIQNMLDNPPQPKLYTPPEPISPENETRVYTPPQNYDGFASFTVEGLSYLNIDLQKWLLKSPDDEPFEMIFDGVVIWDYLAYRQTRMIKATVTRATSIGASAFDGCSSLVELSLPSSLTVISVNAFNGCKSLQTINLSSGITSIGSSAFGGCSSLVDIYMENGFNASGLNVSSSIRYSHDTILSWFNALADRTGQTAYTLTIGTANLNKMTAEEKAIAINKNWNLN